MCPLCAIKVAASARDEASAIYFDYARFCMFWLKDFAKFHSKITSANNILLDLVEKYHFVMSLIIMTILSETENYPKNSNQWQQERYKMIL